MNLTQTQAKIKILKYQMLSYWLTWLYQLTGFPALVWIVSKEELANTCFLILRTLVVAHMGNQRIPSN